MTEKELFPPVRDLFVKRGYKVNAEVRDCDVTATKDNVGRFKFISLQSAQVRCLHGNLKFMKFYIRQILQGFSVTIYRNVATSILLSKPLTNNIPPVSACF